MSSPRRYSRSHAIQGEDPEFESVDMRVVKAISHPLRQRILNACNERAASPSDLAEEWGESRSGVAYHFKVLQELGAIELVDEERVRGSVKHYYRTVLRHFFDDRQWVHLPVELRRSIFDGTIRHVVEDVIAAARGHRLDDPETHISRTALKLDEHGFAELTALLIDVLRRALEIDVESEERRARGESRREIPTELAILHFLRELPPRSA